MWSLPCSRNNRLLLLLLLLHRCVYPVTSFAASPMQQYRGTPPRRQLVRHMTEPNDDESPLLLVRDWDDRAQQIAFVSAFGLLGVGTTGAVMLWNDVAHPLLGDAFYSNIQTTIFPSLFGSIFALVGIAHFVYCDNFARIVPPPGTWGGLWQIPAPGRQRLRISYGAYHSYWTGLVEFFGGLWLLLSSSSLSSQDAHVEAPATLLFFLTIAVTPANLYMFTHNVGPGGKIPTLSYPYGHLARFLLQCGLLSNFWIMMHPI